MHARLIAKIPVACAAIFVAFSVPYSWRAYSSQEVMAPSDDKVIGIFQVHRREFDRLRQMVTEDIPNTAYFSADNISERLPASRRNEYKNLLKVSPGLQVGTNYDGTVRFIFASSGQAIGPSWAKGIEFIPDTGRVIGTERDTLDDSAKLMAGVYLRKLEPRWFLFFQRDE
jgi:hypothetical protein